MYTSSILTPPSLLSPSLLSFPLLLSLQDAALASLKSLNKNDVVEVRSLHNPPQGVKLVIEAVSIMKEVKPRKVPGEKVGAKVSWRQGGLPNEGVPWHGGSVRETVFSGGGGGVLAFSGDASVSSEKVSWMRQDTSKYVFFLCSVVCRLASCCLVSC